MLPPIWILSQKRTGSSYLVHLLNQTGCFSPVFDEYVEKGVLWSKFNKVQWIDYVINNLSREEIENRYPGVKYIHLKRNDVKAIAVSLYCAEKSKKFSVVKDRDFVHNSSTEYVGNIHLREEIKFIPEQLINHYYKRAKSHQNMWKTDFLLEKDEFLEIEYEELVSNPNQTLIKALDYIGVKYDNKQIDLIVKQCHTVPTNRKEYAKGMEILKKKDLRFV